MAVEQSYKQSTVSTSNHTVNYDLPLWEDGDKTSWLEQVNDAMNKIDDGIFDAKTEALKVVGISADAKKTAEEAKAKCEENTTIVSGFDNRLTAVETKVAEHTNDITNLNKRCDQYDIELHSVKETQKKTTEDLGTLAEKVQTNTNNIATLNGNVVELDGRVTTIEEAQTSQGTEITKLTKEVDNLSSGLSTTNTIVSAHTNSISNLSQRVTQAETNISQTNTNLTNLSTNLESEISEVKENVATLGTTITSVGENVDSISDDIDDLSTRVTAVETKNTEQDGQITAIEEVNTEQSGKISNLFVMYGSANDDIIELQEKLKTIDLSGTAQVEQIGKATYTARFTATRILNTVRISLPSFGSNFDMFKFTYDNHTNSVTSTGITLTGNLGSLLEDGVSYFLGTFSGRIMTSNADLMHGCTLQAYLLKSGASAIVALVTCDLWGLSESTEYHLFVDYLPMSFTLEV